MILSILVTVGLTLILCRLWGGILNTWLLDHEPLDSIAARKPYLASHRTVIGTVLGTGLLVLLSLRSLHSVLPLDSNGNLLIAVAGFIGLSGLLVLIEHRIRGSLDYVFSLLVGSIIALILISFQRTLFSPGAEHSPYFLALAVVCVTIVWRLLFGPWDSHVKATVLGTFIVWVGAYILLTEAPEQRLARVLAGVVAIIPAVVWCWFFLRGHGQNRGFVILMFFAGVLSTAPILFYDRLVRSSAELQFFFFTIKPENFNRTSSAFVSGNLIPVGGIRTTLLATLLSFLLVGLIEELSKFWVMRRSGRRFFSSIDDAMQLSIIVAIGFAFAENVLNPTYFIGFIREYLMDSPSWGGFLGNVVGRAILTNMVHIVATGVLGYFFGLALFAGPVIKEKHKLGRALFVADGLRALLGYAEQNVFRGQMILAGLMAATLLHGLFNFLVTFPDILPGNPRSLGELFALADGSILHAVPLLMIPSLFYIVGGFWVLTELFERRGSVKVWGRIVTEDTYVKA